MKVTVRFTYQEHNVIPPRCRKPRTVGRDGQAEIEIPEVIAAQAPIAFRVPAILRGTHDEIRWWDNRLWTRYLPWSRQTEDSVAGSKYFPAERRAGRWVVPYDADGFEQALVHVRRWLNKYVIVDGIVWEETGEPRYVIHTGGLGHNHGGTYLGTNTYYNSNIRRERYFRADRFAEAKTEAVRVAVARGDTDSVQRIETTPPIEVLVPEAVRCQPETEAGDGDPFLNQLDALTTRADSTLEAALFVTTETMRHRGGA